MVTVCMYAHKYIAGKERVWIIINEVQIIEVALYSLLYLSYAVKLNGGRTVTGILRGFDPYMNIVLDDAMEERTSSEKYNIGMVVSVSLVPRPYLSVFQCCTLKNERGPGI